MSKLIKYRLELDGDEISLRIKDGSGGLMSTLKSEEESEEYNSAIDGMESLILAMACKGFNIESREFVECVKETVEHICNHFT